MLYIINYCNESFLCNIHTCTVQDEVFLQIVINHLEVEI